MVDWPQIVERHGPVVWQTAGRLVGNEADAADCFQNVFLAALEVARRGEVRNWTGLLKRLATVESIELLRKRYRHRRNRASLGRPDSLEAKSLSPVQGAQARELADDLREALARLDSRQAEVFCLACLEGFTYEQIADQLNLERNHVGVLLNRARAKLRSELTAHAPRQPERVIHHGERL